MVVTSAVFKLARVVFYLADGRLEDRFLSDAWTALAKRKPLFYTHGFVEISLVLETLFYLLIEGTNFTDAPCSLVVLIN